MSYAGVCACGLAQAQCILFRRYPDILEPFKYGGYPMLLAAVTLPPDDEESAENRGSSHFLSPEKAPLLQARTFFTPLQFSLEILS